MVKLTRFLLVICFAFAINGCAHDMAFTKGQTDLDLSKSSIALLSVKISNKNSPDYPLDLMGALICSESETCGERWNLHKIGSSEKFENENYNEYLLSFKLEAGTYNLHKIHSNYFHPLPIPSDSIGTIPLDLEAKIKPNAVVYLGHLDVSLREKKSIDEETVIVIPSIGDALVGFADGTFDVVVQDRFAEDMKLFIAEYPGLQEVDVVKSILPQWVRPENRPDA